jgi:hypothetical protein
MKKTFLSIFATLIWAITAIAQAAELYVSPDGNHTPPFTE